MANYANIAATNMEALCNDERFGYSQGNRWGDASLGSIYVECEGHTSEFYIGDRDCSSAVITGMAIVVFKAERIAVIVP